MANGSGDYMTGWEGGPYRWSDGPKPITNRWDLPAHTGPEGLPTPLVESPGFLAPPPPGAQVPPDGTDAPGQSASSSPVPFDLGAVLQTPVLGIPLWVVAAAAWFFFFRKK